MPTIGVIHQDEDAFVRDWVLPPLPALGFDRALVMPAAALRPPALEQCAAIVVVAGANAEATEFVTRSRVPALTVLRADPSALADLPPTGTPTIDVRALAERSDLWRRLPWLLQEPGRAADEDPAAEVLTWDDGAFSVLLDEATARDDAALAAELVERFERCARQRPGGPPRSAQPPSVRPDAPLRGCGDRHGDGRPDGPPPVRAGPRRAEGVRRRR